MCADVATHLGWPACGSVVLTSRGVGAAVVALEKETEQVSCLPGTALMINSWPLLRTTPTAGVLADWVYFTALNVPFGFHSRNSVGELQTAKFPVGERSGLPVASGRSLCFHVLPSVLPST